MRSGVRVSGAASRVRVSAGESRVSVAVRVAEGGAETYGGPYEVTPRIDAQVLGTRGRLMSGDVDVRGIPEYLTSNSAGGYTCNIG